MIYLASPYTHSNPHRVISRYQNTCHFVAKMLEQGAPIFSTIVHNHNLAKQYSLPTDQEFWWDYNKQMLKQSREVWVLMLDGWEDSAGVRREIDYATVLGLPVEYMEMPDD